MRAIVCDWPQQGRLPCGHLRGGGTLSIICRTSDLLPFSQTDASTREVTELYSQASYGEVGAGVAIGTSRAHSLSLGCLTFVFFLLQRTQRRQSLESVRGT